LGELQIRELADKQVCLHHCYVNIISMKTKYLIPNILLLFSLLCSTAFSSKEETIHGKVMQVKDGDAIVISPIKDGQFFFCRLYGIETPEITTWCFYSNN